MQSKLPPLNFDNLPLPKKKNKKPSASLELRKDNFVAIDFETATGSRNSACAIAIITVENELIVDEYYTLIKPPGNYYWQQNIAVHGITPHDTINAPTFEDIYCEVKKRMKGKQVVAHNEAFDRGVLKNSMAFYDIAFADLQIDEPWHCTVKIYRSKGFSPANLNSCCERMNIALKHHEALSDARACATLYLLA